MSAQDTDPSTNPKNQNFQNSINTRPATADELAYRDGYVRGQAAKQREQADRRALESRIYAENARRQANEGVSIGLVFGLTLAALAAIIGGLFYVYRDTDNPNIPDIIVPTPEANSPEPSSETTIIERTIERTQEVVPTPSQITLPDVNVDVTPPPAAQPTPEAAEPNTAEPSATESNTSAPEAAGSNSADAQTSGSEAQPQ